LSIFRESFRFAVQNIGSNLLRTLLSLTGVTIGVFCIIAILTLIDSLEANIRDSFAKLGNNMLFIQKFPIPITDDADFRAYMRRPEMKFSEMKQLQSRLKHASAVSFAIWIPNEKLKSDKQEVTDAIIRAASYQYGDIVDMNYAAGRYFTEAETSHGEPIIILGYDLASTLFNDPLKAIGQNVKVLGRKLKVVGVLKKEGNSIGFNGNIDNSCLIPVEFVRTLGDFQSAQNNNTILVKADHNTSLDELETEVEGVFRTIRRLSPREDDNFAVNKISVLSNILSKVFGQISLYGWIIAGFSILVGGFGIANIMFVSVKERTSIIGIQKALGAKGGFIMIQFLFEAVLLCVFGGLIGLTLVLMLSLLFNLILPFTLILSIKNILIGVGISSAIGILAGIIPSYIAAKMDPIEAIRYNS
jgi:putative ABC transport system permease protein